VKANSPRIYLYRIVSAYFAVWDPKGPRPDSRRVNRHKNSGGQRGQHRSSLCSRGFSCHAICCSYVMIVESVIPRLSCFVTDNASRNAFVFAPLSSFLSFSPLLPPSFSHIFILKKRVSFKNERYNSEKACPVLHALEITVNINVHR